MNKTTKQNFDLSLSTDKKENSQTNIQSGKKNAQRLNHKPVDKIVLQLKRIQGQVVGIAGMIEKERDCVEIVRQVVATRNSLSRVARDLLSGEVTKCSRTQNWSQLEDLLKETLR